MRRRARRHTGLRTLIIVIIIAAAVMAVLFGVFNIHHVEVSGNEQFTAEQIQKDLMDSRLTHNTLYLGWKYRNAQAQNEVPYLDSVQVKILSPSSVRINVTEKPLVGTIQYSSQYACFDDEGIVLKLLDSQPEDMPLVTGIMMDSPELYQKLAMDNTALRKNMLDLCGILSDSELDVKTVNFDDNLNITLYIGNIEAELGQAEYLSEKIANLVSLYEKVKNQKGTLNMTAFTGSDEPITFEEETESETEGETDITSLQNYDTYFQVYDSNGVLHNDARVVNGAVVDSAGNAISGCSLNEDGNVVDAYQNVITLNLPTESNQTETSASAGGNDTLGTSSVTGQTSETAAETQASQETTADSSTQQDTAAQNETSDSSTLTAGSGVMAFDSNGTLHYDARIVNGQVVDSSGNVISGCTVTEDGNIKEAYWNIIDPATGANLNGQ